MNTHKNNNELRYIIVYENDGAGNQTEHELIIEETICQYTGLKDIEGKEIYEGDIIEREFIDFSDRDKFIGIVKFYGGSYWIDKS